MVPTGADPLFRGIGGDRGHRVEDAFQLPTANALSEGSMLPPPSLPTSTYGSNIESAALEVKKRAMERVQSNLDGCAAGRILQFAHTATTTDRQVTHGPKERSFHAIAGLWNSYLAARPGFYENLEARDVAMMMVLLKIGRALQGTPTEDHFVDMAGYSAVAGELSV